MVNYKPIDKKEELREIQREGKRKQREKDIKDWYNFEKKNQELDFAYMNQFKKPHEKWFVWEFKPSPCPDYQNHKLKNE